MRASHREVGSGIENFNENSFVICAAFIGHGSTILPSLTLLTCSKLLFQFGFHCIITFSRVALVPCNSYHNPH